MATYLIEGNPNGIDRLEAKDFADAEAKLAASGGGDVVGELVEEGEYKSGKVACALTELKFADVGAGDEMTIAGYGAYFNNVDSGGDRILPNAFQESLASLKAANTAPMMLYQHGAMGGGPVMPVGKWTMMQEDNNGLRVEGKLFDHSIGRDLYVALKGGGIGGLSIGYRVKALEPKGPNSDARRHIKSADLIEVSLVNQPMNPMARVLSVKSADDLKNEIKTLAALGHLLREANGWSRAQTEAVMSNFQAKANQGEPDRDAAIVVALKRSLSLLKS